MTTSGKADLDARVPVMGSGNIFDRTTPSDYRMLMSAVPTSIVVAASMTHEGPVGMVIGTFTSVSMDPPLVGFFGDRRSRSLEPVIGSGSISFGLLRQQDLAVCEAFRGPLHERFDGLNWRVSEHGTPQLDDAVFTVHGRIHDVVPAGDHRCVLVEVVDLTTSSMAARPLIFYKHRLMRMDPGQVVDDEMWQLGRNSDEWGRSEWG